MRSSTSPSMCWGLALFLICGAVGWTSDRSAPELSKRSNAGMQVLVVDQLTGKPVPFASVGVLTGELALRRELRMPARMRAKNLEGLVTDFGLSLRCDDKGVVFIPPPMEAALVSGRLGRAYGESHIHGVRDAEPVVVEIRERPLLVARVVDERGVPQTGVSVSVWVRPNNDMAAVAREVTDREGFVRFEHVDCSRWWGRAASEAIGPAGGFEWGAENRGPVALVLDAPQRDTPFTWVNTIKLPREPVIMVLKRGGGVQIRVEDLDGGTPRQPCTVVLGSYDSDYPGVHCTLTDENGVARFPHVGLRPKEDVYYAKVFAPLGQSAFQSPVTPVRAPSQVREERAVSIRLKLRHPVLVGTLVDNEGILLKNKSFGVGLSRDATDSYTVSRLSRTDARGRFTIPLTRYLSLDHDPLERGAEGRLAAPTLRLRFSHRDACGLHHGHYEWPSQAPPGPGMHSLGRVHLRPTSLLASGKIVDTHGAPQPSARVWIQVQDAEVENWWRESSYRVAGWGLTDAQGRFEIHSPLNQWRVPGMKGRLAVRSTGFVESYSDPFTLVEDLPLVELKLVLKERPRDWIVRLRLPDFAKPSEYYGVLSCEGGVKVRATAIPTAQTSVAEIRFRGVSDAAQANSFDSFRVQGPLGRASGSQPILAQNQPSSEAVYFDADLSHHIQREVGFYSASGALVPVVAITVRQGKGDSWWWPPDEDGVFRFSAAPGAMDVRISLPPKGFDHLFGPGRPVREWKVSEPKGRITVE